MICSMSGPPYICGHCLSLWVEFPSQTVIFGGGTNFKMNTGIATMRQSMNTIPHLQWKNGVISNKDVDILNTVVHYSPGYSAKRKLK